MAIVIPAYKGRFLKETLDSIAVQAHKDEFVLYIGDDASPERLDKIVESYQNKVNLVYHRFSENMGGKDLVAHWERCIQLAADKAVGNTVVPIAMCPCGHSSANKTGIPSLVFSTAYF